MEFLSPPPPPRTYELRNDPIKMIGLLAFGVGVAVFGLYNDGFWMKASGGFFAFCAVVIILRMGNLVALLATPEGLKITRGLGWYWRIPWADVTGITVFDFGKYGGAMVWIRVSDNSAGYMAWPEPLRVISGSLRFPTDGYFVKAVGSDPAEVAEELKALYAEYVRDGVLKPGNLSVTLATSASM